MRKPIVFALIVLLLAALACNFNPIDLAEEAVGTALATAGIDLDEAQQMLGTAMSTEFAGTLEALQDLSDQLQAAGDVIFIDDFSDTSSGWPRVGDNDELTDYSSGGYRIFVNADNDSLWANSNRGSYGDVRVEVDATKIGGPDENKLGLICRHSDINNFYVAVITSEGFYGFYSRVNGGNIELIGMDSMQQSDAIVLGSGTNRIRLDCLGSTLTLYVNGVLVDLVTDTTHTFGDVGLFAGTFDIAGTDILFDNFVVYQP